MSRAAPGFLLVALYFRTAKIKGVSALHKALYRKWRPKTFDDVIGQEHITEVLKRQVETSRLSHAYLFVGTRGVGKTTCAKILARAINCLEPEGGNPCNRCASCRGIDSGAVLDVAELDAASNNRVEDIRALKEEFLFTPADVKKRVYIFDEVHMLSPQAFSALLQILEEPPEHVIFVLATTEVHKVPATILSRCQRFTFRRIRPEDIAGRLSAVAAQEGIALTEDAAGLLARLADGSMRDALSLLDQCASSDAVDSERVLYALGLAGSLDTAAVFSAVSEGDLSSALKLLDRLYMAGKVMSSFVEELMGLARDLLITATMPNGGSALLSGAYDAPTLRDLASRQSPERLIRDIEILRDALSDISRGTGGRLAAEVCLVRMCAARAGAALSSPRDFPDAKAPAPENAASPHSSPPASPPAAEEPSKKRVEPAPPAGRKSSPGAGTDEDAAGSPGGQSGASPEPGYASREAASAPGNVWEAILERIRPEIDLPHYLVLSNEAQISASLEGGVLKIRSKTEFGLSIAAKPSVAEAIRAAAAAVLGRAVAVQAEQDNPAPAAGGDKLDNLRRFPNVTFE